MGYDFSQATEMMREGKRLRRASWDREADPAFVVLIPGRQITPTYEPMVTHLGARPFVVAEHIDAIFVNDGAEDAAALGCIVGYPLTQADVLAVDWAEAEKV